MKEAIGNKQIIFIVFASVVGFPFSIAEDFSMYAGTGGWIIGIICALISIPPILIISWLNKQHEKKALHEYIEDITGKYLAFPIMIFFFIRYLVGTLMATVSLIVRMKLTILETTPFWPLALIFIICCSYTASKGIKSLSYIYEFFAIVFLSIALLLIFAMFSKGRFINLRPFFVKEDIPIYLRESFKNLIAFAGFDKLLFVPLFKKENKKVNTYLILGIISVVLFYIATFEATVSVSGINDTVLSEDSFLLSVRRVELKYFDLLKRLDAFAIANFTFSALMIVSLNLYAASSILSYYLKKLNFKNANLNISSIFLCIISFLVCINSPNIFTSKIYFKIASIISVTASYIIPIILFMIVKVKNYEKKTL